MVKIKLKLLRYVRPSPDEYGRDVCPTLGVLFVNNKYFCYTLEPSWKNNYFNSCIPDGTYKVQHYTSQKFGKCLIVQGAPGRSGILIHKGNVATDTTGCILVGCRIGFISGSYAVLGSSVTFMRLINRMIKFESIKIKIKTISKQMES
jgi:hypothetical protein